MLLAAIASATVALAAMLIVVVLRARQRIHALRLEVTRISAQCGALQDRVDALADAGVGEMALSESLPMDALPLIDLLDRGGRLTAGTPDRLRILTMDIRAEALADREALKMGDL